MLERWSRLFHRGVLNEFVRFDIKKIRVLNLPLKKSILILISHEIGI